VFPLFAPVQQGRFFSELFFWQRPPSLVRSVLRTPQLLCAFVREISHWLTMSKFASDERWRKQKKQKTKTQAHDN